MNDFTKDLEEYIDIYTKMGSQLSRELTIIPECVLFKKTYVGDVFSDYHHHLLFEILYIKQGKVTFFIDEKKYNLTSGDIIFISPSKLHKLESINCPNCERIVINFTSNYITKLSTKQTDLLKLFKYINDTKNYYIHINVNYLSKVNKLIEQMLESQYSKEYAADLTFNYAFIQLIVLFLKIYESTPIEDHQDSTNPIINKINSYIVNTIDKHITIDDIAKYVNLSSSRVCHIFKEETGVSLNAYIIKRKLLVATELLRENQKSIDIYEKCGFLNYNNFLRTFKKEYGISPKEYIEGINKIKTITNK